MKNHLLSVTLFFLLISIQLSAQKYTYLYDGAGNRTKVTLFKSSLANQDSTDLQKPVEVADQGREFKLYPNPTKGIITVECLELPEASKVTCTLYDGGGRFISKTVADNRQSFQFDMSVVPNGLYILQVQVNGTKHVLKVLKE